MLYEVITFTLELIQVQVLHVREVNTVPAVTLILHPAGLALVVFRSISIGAWHRELGVLELAVVTRRRMEIRMHALMGQVHHEGLVLVTMVKPVDSVIGQFVGDVALLIDHFTIDIQLRSLAHHVDRVIVALAQQANPAIEAGKARLGFFFDATEVPSYNFV